MNDANYKKAKNLMNRIGFIERKIEKNEGLSRDLKGYVKRVTVLTQTLASSKEVHLEGNDIPSSISDISIDHLTKENKRMRQEIEDFKKEFKELWEIER